MSRPSPPRRSPLPPRWDAAGRPGAPGATPPVGPVETGLLAQLAPAVVPQVHWLPGGGAVRILEGGPPEGAHSTVVFLHGRGNAATHWFPYLTALARHHRVLALDLPGFGQSTPADVHVRSAEDAVRFFTAPVEEALGLVAPGPVSVVGHSLGGLVALELALRGAVPVERLVLVDAMGLGPEMPRASRLFFRAGPERLARNLGPWAMARMLPPPPTPLGEKLGQLGYELLSVPGGRPEAAQAFNALVPLTGPLLHRRERLGEVKVPVLLIWGERDETLPVSLADEAARHLPLARVLRVACGHSPQLEHPERVLPELKAFLDAEPSRP
ncbi:alpha/beta fold family hydrolase [Corallococcus coralloides]|uniref:Alpha/beta fold family hydrolase n=1 Tax=Corallococcus coralloides TaxID=184914 RepID=A0A410RZL3_CORCK|nr:alpha/beta fold hydrolase [Corallococcus coralloides]QAT87399.1 alpha/beta fold family hydrolase [Corallococcus coralloides]